jgi:3-carboxy-cis,cis-muconate cycloisomerase
VLSARIDRDEAVRRVGEAAAGGSLREGLRGSLSAEELDAMLDPTTYLGSARELVDRALASYRESVT